MALCWVFFCLLAENIILLSYSHGAAATAAPLYRDANASVDARVVDLLSRMTPEEKMAQIVLPFGAKFPQDYVKYNKTGLGATYPLPSLPGMSHVATRNLWQRWQVEGTRLGIPTSFIAETLHSGYSGGTVFPMPSLQGCTWNAPLVSNVAAVIAKEARANGVDRGFSPVLHMCTDPRFGRCEESFGEDPALVANLGVAAVTGLQGPGAAGAASTYLEDPTVHISTEAKHFAAYGFGGRDEAYADMSENTLYDVYLRPWRDFAQAGGRGVMGAHESVNGMPCHANHALLTTALRDQFGFGNGLIAGDAGDVRHLTAFHIANDCVEAAALALSAGMDQELDAHGCYGNATQAVTAGLLAQHDLDRAVGNVLRQKIAVGLLDPEDQNDLLYVNETRAAAVLDLPESRAMARRVAEEGIVLLRNGNVSQHSRRAGGPLGPPAAAAAAANVPPILPLQGLGTTLKHVAVIGPNADNAHSTQGGYVQGGAHVVTVLEGAVQAANASGNAFDVTYARGTCLGATPGCTCPAFKPGVDIPCGLDDASDIEAAAALAAKSDVTVLVLGDSSTVLAGDASAHEETGTCGEHFDRDNLDLPGLQVPLLQAVLNASQNVIVVLITGRTATFGSANNYDPRTRNALFFQASAVLAAWRPGEEAGSALWRLLNGTVNPSGRSAHTWPRSVGQVHQYVPWYLPAGSRPNSDGYADQARATPLVAFGEGLSYTEFTFDDVKLSTATVAPDGTFSVSLNVSSNGPAGACVIQVYYSQDKASRVRYSKMLLGFTKVPVPANSKGTPVTIPLRAHDMAMWNVTRAEYVVEPGNFHVYVGQSSIDQKTWHGEISVSPQSSE